MRGLSAIAEGIVEAIGASSVGRGTSSWSSWNFGTGIRGYWRFLKESWRLSWLRVGSEGHLLGARGKM